MKERRIAALASSARQVSGNASAVDAVMIKFNQVSLGVEGYSLPTVFFHILLTWLLKCHSDPPCILRQSLGLTACSNGSFAVGPNWVVSLAFPSPSGVSAYVLNAAGGGVPTADCQVEVPMSSICVPSHLCSDVGGGWRLFPFLPL